MWKLCIVCARGKNDLKITKLSAEIYTTAKINLNNKYKRINKFEFNRTKGLYIRCHGRYAYICFVFVVVDDMLFCIVTFNLWLHFNKLLTYLLTYLHISINFIVRLHTDARY